MRSSVRLIRFHLAGWHLMSLTKSKTGTVILTSGSARMMRLSFGWMVGIGAWGLVATQRDQFPPWAFMWLSALMIFAVCKMLTLLNFESPQRLGFGRLVGYLVLWPGMRPRAFLPSRAAET